jgi:hypothetical protein
MKLNLTFSAMKNKLVILFYCLFTALFINNISAQVNLNEGLVFYLPFNNNSLDFGPNSFNVGNDNSPAAVNDRLGNASMASSFNGSNQSFWLGNQSAFRALNNFTFSVWFKTTILKDQIMIAKHLGDLDGEWYFGMLASGKMRLAHVTDSRVNADFDFAYNDGEWHHAVGLYDGSKLEIFIDGNLLGSLPRTGQTKSTNHSLYIGKYSGTDWFFNGSLDEVYVYNRALNIQEINELKESRSIAIGNITGTEFCKGAEISIPYTVTGKALESNNNFTAYLSDKNGSFRYPRALNTIQSTGSGTFNFNLPSDIASGSLYRIMIMASNLPLASIGDNGSNLTVNIIEEGIDLKTNLFGYFKLDGNLDDDTDFKRNLSVVGSSEFFENHEGETEKAKNLTGGYLNWGRPNEIIHNHGPQDVLTIAMWLKPTSSTNHFIPIANNWNNMWGGVYMGINPDTKGIRWRVNATGSTDAPGIALNEWVHVVCVLSDGRLRVYYNGEKKTDASSGGGIAGINQDFLIGRQSSGTSEVHYRGGIDEVYFFKRGLNDNEVKALFHEGLAFYNPGICIGQNLELSSMNITGASYQWSGPENFSSTIYNPVINNVGAANQGMYELTITKDACVNKYNLNVKLNTELDEVTVNNNSPVCEGSNIELSASTLAGVTYSWIGPDGFSSNEKTISITNSTSANSGIYTLSLTKGSCNLQKEINVLVNSIPVTPDPSSNGPVCEGNDLQLFADEVSNATYLWSGPEGFSSTERNASRNNITASQSGNYNLKITVNGCESQLKTLAVEVKPVANVIASNSGPYCAGNDISLSATEITGANYNWSGPENFAFSGRNANISGATLLKAGEYTVNVELANGCNITSSTSVVINSNPPAPEVSVDSSVCEDDNIGFTTSATDVIYLWTGPNGFSSDLQNPSISNASLNASGTYSLVVFKNNCPSEATEKVVNVKNKPQTPQISSNAPVCNGDDLNLFASAVNNATYSWTGPAGFISDTQNPGISNTNGSNSGTYYMSIIIDGCESDKAELSVTINVVDVNISGNINICEGDDLVLSVPESSGAVYSWTGPNGFSSEQHSIARTNASQNIAGIYNVSKTVNGCSGENTVTVVVKAIPTAPTASNNGPVCEGQSINLTASSISGASYSWSGPNGFISNNQNPVINPANDSHAGEYIVRAIVNECSSVAQSTSVVVNSIGVITADGNSPVCSGNTLNLTATSIANASYSWTGPNGFSSILQNPVLENIATNAAGTYILTVTVGSCSKQTTRQIVVNESPVKPIITVNQFINNIIQSSSIWNNQWYKNGNILTGEVFSDLNLQNHGPGSYTVKVTNSSNCSSESDPYHYLVAEISENQKDLFKIFPNPANQYLNLSIPDSFVGEKTLKIFNYKGQAVYETRFDENFSQTNLTISLENFAPGNYLIFISNDSQSIIEKLIINK